MELNPRVYQNTSQFANEMASSYPCGPISEPKRLSELCLNKNRWNRKLTRQLELTKSSPTPQIVLVLVSFPQTLAVFLVFRILFPMLLRAMRRPTAVWALISDCTRLCLRMSMNVGVGACAYGTGSKLLDGFPSGAYCGKRRLGEGMEEVVLGKDRNGLCWCRLFLVFSQETED